MQYRENRKTDKGLRNGAGRLFSFSLIHGFTLCALLLTSASQHCGAQSSNRASPGSSKIGYQPAIPAILSAFDKYEVVGMPAAHELKDVDDLILSLIRVPEFSEKVNDIVVECGNIRYQPILDRYIAGENVPFAEIQKVWRNTTQPMCGQSGFFEQLYPLVRSLNQNLSAAKRLRIVAADPPIDWDQIHSSKDTAPYTDRDGSIASVMEKEVLSQHRKALMLFGIFHLLHGSGPGQGNAVTIYERHYPGRTFVISILGYYGAENRNSATVPFTRWSSPSLVKTKNSQLGSLGLNAFLPTPITTDGDCNVVNEFEGQSRKPVADLIDAFLYLGPQNLQLREPVPADIALDTAYMTEWVRRMKASGFPSPGTLEELNTRIVAGAADPILVIPRNPNVKELYPFIRQNCIDRKAQN